MGEDNETGDVYLSADGISLSTTSQNLPIENVGLNTLSLPYKIEHGIFCQKVHVSIAPQFAGGICADITLKKEKDEIHIPTCKQYL